MRIGKRSAAAAIAAAAVGSAIAISGTAGAATQAPAPGAGGGPVVAAADAALEQMAANGTLSRTQADAIEAQVNAGSIDPKQLVNDGVVTDAQMRTVANAIEQIKRDNG